MRVVFVASISISINIGISMGLCIYLIANARRLGKCNSRDPLPRLFQRSLILPKLAKFGLALRGNLQHCERHSMR